MNTNVMVLGEALMDCVAQPDGRLLPLLGGSPYNMARAAARRGASVAYLNPLSTDRFGEQLGALLHEDGVRTLGASSAKPTSLAVVQIQDGQPSYGFYREGIADRDASAAATLALLEGQTTGILHTGSLMLVPPENDKILTILVRARQLGWTISVDVNLRPRLAADLHAYVQAVLEVLPHTDWLKASDEDLETLGFENVTISNAPQLVAALRRRAGSDRLSRVALTFGAQGAYLDVNGQVAQAPVPSIQVVDTVGAGDTFWGNCVADWATTQGGDERCTATLAHAMTAAAINCTRQGCQPPSWQEISAAAGR
jgi:fructokinase